MPSLKASRKHRPLRGRYIGQCDQLRRSSPKNEEKWQRMMCAAERISFQEFLANINIAPILAFVEDQEMFLRNTFQSDPTTGTYRSWWGQKRCWFLQTAGFEFIFYD